MVLGVGVILPNRELAYKFFSIILLVLDERKNMISMNKVNNKNMYLKGKTIKSEDAKIFPIKSFTPALVL